MPQKMRHPSRVKQVMQPQLASIPASGTLFAEPRHTWSGHWLCKPSPVRLPTSGPRPQHSAARVRNTEGLGVSRQQLTSANWQASTIPLLSILAPGWLLAPPSQWSSATSPASPSLCLGCVMPGGTKQPCTPVAHATSGRGWYVLHPSACCLAGRQAAPFAGRTCMQPM